MTDPSDIVWVPGQPGIVRARGRIEASSANGDVSDFDSRVTSRRVDLLKLIKEGLPAIEYLPASEGMLIKGKRHQVAAPRKTGKSLGMLVHWVRMALAGARILILDRENGRDEYARRLDAIMVAWGLAQRDKTRIGRNLHYFEFPKLEKTDGEHLVKLAAGFDIVVFDAQRQFLTDLGFKEGEADDYSKFMRLTIEPLFSAGVATVILDNTGHANPGRARGSSAKGDLNEVLFTLEAAEPFSRDHQGRLKLKLEPGDSRFGNQGEWEMRIGGGAFSPWKRTGGEEKSIDPAFQSAALRFANAAGSQGISQTKLLKAIRDEGISFRNEDGREALYRMAKDPDLVFHMTPPDGPGQAVIFYGDPAAWK